MRVTRAGCSSVRTIMRHRLTAAFVLSAALLAPACGSDEPDVATTPIVLDYSPTLSDSGGLLYLAASPAVDLLAVTLAGTGESECAVGVRTTRALLVLAERPDVPVACGRTEPLEGSRTWPDAFRPDLSTWQPLLPDVEDGPIGDAELLLVDVLGHEQRPVTVVTLGPLTNMGAVLESRPALEDEIARVVVMGGAVDVAGNVEDAPTAEWNLYIDPVAVRHVLDSGVPVDFVTLDATNALPWTERYVARLAALDGPPAEFVRAVAGEMPSLEGIYLWDELAAMAAVVPELVTFETVSIEVDDDGATLRSPAGVRVRASTSTDAEAARAELLRVLNGGALPDQRPLAPADSEHLMALAAADSDAMAAMDALFRSVPLVEPSKDDVREFLDGFLAVAAGLHDAVAELEPSESLAALHEQYVASLAQVAESGRGLRAIIDAAPDDAGFDEVLAEVADSPEFAAANEQARRACRALEQYSFQRGGPRPCSLDSGL